MELTIFGNKINLLNLGIMTFLYIFTVSMTLCGTLSVEDIKGILSLDFLNDVKKDEKDEKEGFKSLFKHSYFNDCPCKNKTQSKCKKFSENKYINNNSNHPLHDDNATIFEPASYDLETNFQNIAKQ